MEKAIITEDVIRVGVREDDTYSSFCFSSFRNPRIDQQQSFMCYGPGLVPSILPMFGSLVTPIS